MSHVIILGTTIHVLTFKNSAIYSAILGIFVYNVIVVYTSILRLKQVIMKTIGEDERKELVRLEKIIHDEVVMQGGETRDSAGRFIKGVPGSWRGRGKTADGAKMLKILATGVLEEMFEMLCELRHDPQAGVKDKIEITKMIWDRAAGKPTQGLHIRTDDRGIGSMTGEEIEGILYKKLYKENQQILDGKEKIK